MKKVNLVNFVNFSQRDEVIRPLDQAAGISFNTRTKRLSYSHYSTHKPGEKCCAGQEMVREKKNSFKVREKTGNFILIHEKFKEII